MTDILAPIRRAHHGDGLAIFNAALVLLREAGWDRQRVDTLIRSDHHMQVRHHYSAGRWELHFERRPRWERLAHSSSLPYIGTEPRVAHIDLYRPLPSTKAVLSDLFGPHHAVCAHPVPERNGKAAQ